MQKVQAHTTDKYGADTHPAFALIGASRIQVSPPGAVLFDSDVQHHNVIRVRVMGATRSREISRDWIHGNINQTYVEVEMSEAQWASFVSSMNSGDGVPATVRQTLDDYEVPGLLYDPRLAHSMRETRAAAHEAFDEIKIALDRYVKTIENKAPAKERNEALSNLQAKIRNATVNVNYAGKTLAEHAENVVQKARADIEAMVLSKAHQLGITAVDLGGDTLAIDAGDEEKER